MLSKARNFELHNLNGMNSNSDCDGKLKTAPKQSSTIEYNTAMKDTESSIKVT
jgi:hypothetical protein